MATAKTRLNQPLIVICGPTASGKTQLAIELAEKLNGEIICADSRTIYRGMDIGTAKPSQDDQLKVAHWGLDLVLPGERFTVADFKKYADQKIATIRSNGRVPIMVGGSGLYVDSVIFNYQFGPPVNVALRSSLQEKTVEQLHDHCIKNNINLPENTKNKRYLIRAIEQKNNHSTDRQKLINNCIVVGITTENEQLRERITARIEHMFENDVVGEAKLLGDKYGWDSEAMTGNIYRLIGRYLEGEFDIDQLKRMIVTADWRLAKRQLTWLKRNQHITWIESSELQKYVIQEFNT